MPLIDIISKILTNALTALYQPFWFSVLLSIFFMFFWLYSHEEIGSKNATIDNGADTHPRGYKQSIKTWLHTFKTSSTFRKTFFLAFYTTMILFQTLLNRKMSMNPLSKVLSGWWIYETASDGTVTLKTECIENVILMVPFTVLLMWALRADETAREKIFKSGVNDNGTVKISTVLWQSVKITFLFSVAIEFLQLFLRLGTWQLSDVFYNVLGGFIGGLIYWIGWKVKHRGERVNDIEEK